MEDSGVQTKDTVTTQALIIGGGVAGCALSLFLKRIGIDAIIFERYPQSQAIGGIGGGLNVAPNGMQVMEILGLGDAIRAEGVIGHRFLFFNRLNKQISTIECDKHRHPSHPSGVSLTRPALHKIFLDEVAKQGVKILFDKRLVAVEGLEVEEGGKAPPVIARFEDGTVARGDFIVGADGAHSRVRRCVLEADYKKASEDEDPYLEYLGLMTSGGFVQSDIFLKVSERDQGDCNFFMGPRGRSFGYCRAAASDPRLVMWWRNVFVGFLGGDKKEEEERTEEGKEEGGEGSKGQVMQWQWKGRVPTREELKAIDIDELKKILLDIPGGWPDHIQRLVKDTDVIQRGTIHTLMPLPSWYRGRAVLVGDAAHAVSPHSGQGASLALEDAMYLAKLLRLALRKEEGEGGVSTKKALEELFGLFQEARKDRAEAVVAEGKRRGEPRKKLIRTGDEKDAELEVPPGPVKQWFLDMFVKAIFTFLVPIMFKQLTGYVITWDDCTSLKELRQKQQQRKGGWMKSVGVWVAVAAVAVGTTATMYWRFHRAN